MGSAVPSSWAKRVQEATKEIKKTEKIKPKTAKKKKG